jgi:hypothetical protein
MNILDILGQADQVPLWPSRVFNVISCIVTWHLALFVSGFRDKIKEFSFANWWKDNRNQFVAGYIVTFSIVILKATSPTVDTILKSLGFQITESSGVSYGLAIAAFLLGLKTANGQKQNERKEK